MEEPNPIAETRPAAGTDSGARGPRLREIPLRLIVPNLITGLAICAGLTGVRLAFENRYELAVALRTAHSSAAASCLRALRAAASRASLASTNPRRRHLRCR